MPLIWSLINQTSVLVCTKATSQYIPCPASWLSENHTAQNKRPFTTKSIICFHLFKFYAVKCAKTLIFCFIDFLFYWLFTKHCLGAHQDTCHIVNYYCGWINVVLTGTLLTLKWCQDTAVFKFIYLVFLTPLVGPNFGT